MGRTWLPGWEADNRPSIFVIWSNYLGAAGSRIPPSSAGEGKCGGLKSVMEQMTEGFGCKEEKGCGSDVGADGEGGDGNWG